MIALQFYFIKHPAKTLALGNIKLLLKVFHIDGIFKKLTCIFHLNQLSGSVRCP